MSGNTSGGIGRSLIYRDAITFINGSLIKWLPCFNLILPLANYHNTPKWAEVCELCGLFSMDRSRRFDLFLWLFCYCTLNLLNKVGLRLPKRPKSWAFLVLFRPFSWVHTSTRRRQRKTSYTEYSEKPQALRTPCFFVYPLLKLHNCNSVNRNDTNTEVRGLPHALATFLHTSGCDLLGSLLEKIWYCALPCLVPHTHFLSPQGTKKGLEWNRSPSPDHLSVAPSTK